MSQILNFGMGGIPPAGVVETLTGNFGGPVSPLAGNIDVTGGFTGAAPDASSSTFGFSQTIGNSNPNTLEIRPLNSILTTNDGVPTFFPLAHRNVAASTAIVMSATVIGNRDDYSAACGGICTGVARRDAIGGVVFVGDNAFSNEDAVGGTPQFGINVNGTDIAVYVQGLVGQTWKWTCTYTFQIQITS